MKRRTIGENPLDALVPPPTPTETRREKTSPRKASRKPTERPQAVSRTTKERLTVHLPTDVVNRAKDAVYWSPGLTLAGLAEEAFVDALTRLEKKHGGPFPPRKGELKGGRPMK